jgi:hypothetical protein
MSQSNPARRFPWWILAGGLLIALGYLPTLGARFDFVDDGNLVYPEPPMPLASRIAVAWDKVVANYLDLGPFRPVLWAHWEVTAELCGGQELAWRACRLLWCAFAATVMLWLLAELNIPPLAALFVGALSLWAPFRNEVWSSLTLSEGVAMPYALLALVCARLAARSPAPLWWDVGGAACVLAAMGCKNTFVALIPAQMFLRIAEDGATLSEGWRKHGRRALLLSLTALAFLAHYVYFKLDNRPNHYRPGMPELSNALGLLNALRGAAALEYMAPGVILALLAARGAGWLDLRHRAALGAGVLLLTCGYVIYLPINAISGRYTMPAVWGVDLLVAVALASLAAAPATRLRWVASAALAAGLAGVLVASLGKQQKFAARADMLWQAVAWAEANVPEGGSVAFLCGEPARGGLHREEGVHFQWHLWARGRRDVRVFLYDGEGQPMVSHHLPLPHPDEMPQARVWGSGDAPAARAWKEQGRAVAKYWAGTRAYECRLGRSVTQ